MEAVLHQYLSMVPLRKLLWTLSIDEKLQKSIIEEVVSHPLAKRYPPSFNYRKAFLKHLMAQAEAASVPVAEEIYEAYAELVSVPMSEVCFKSYYIGSGIFVTLKESINMISDGTTGLTTWQAALHFVEWATNAKQHSLLHRKKILELGSGTGLAGIAISYLCNPSEYHFTDHHNQVLEKLKENVERNLHFECDKHNTTIKKLDWTSEDCLASLSDHYDVIIATDVVYDTCLSDAFVIVLSKLLRHYSSVAYVASTIRNPETYEYFCSKLVSAGLKKRVMDGPTVNLFYYDRTQTIEILEIHP